MKTPEQRDQLYRLIDGPDRNGHLSMKNGQPHVLIPENDHGIPEGAQDVVALLRQHADNPVIVRFIADMLEI